MSGKHLPSIGRAMYFVTNAGFDEASAPVCDEETLRAAWQQLVNTGEVWKLPGSYGRFAAEEIQRGWLLLPVSPHTYDNYGSRVPSRFEAGPYRVAVGKRWKKESGYYNA